MEHVGKFTSPRWGVVNVQLGHYGGLNGPAAIVLVLADGERLGTLSVNMCQPECSRDSQDLPEDCFYAKTWSENEELAKDALKSWLFVQRDDLPSASSGFVSAPVWQIKASEPEVTESSFGEFMAASAS